MGDSETATIRVLNGASEISAADWDACANPGTRPFDPFVSHAFFNALETSGSASAETGWLPRHLALVDEAGAIRALMPLYLKSHSMGEYVFDHPIASAHEREIGPYYPKLQCSVPFTPVTGRRMLVRPGMGETGTEERMLLAGALKLAEMADASSLHITFPTAAEWEAHGGLLAQRTGIQYHWDNQGYGSYEDFLGALASRKRKALRKERRDAVSGGMEIEWLTGNDITEAHWDAMFAFYRDTGSRKWGRPYLNRRFFSLIGETMARHVLLVLAKRDGRVVAGALNFIGGDCLYGRYWGCVEDHPFLHFELCYHQAIDYAIAHKLARVEAGAQGEHKIARGYAPKTTYSLHWARHAGLHRSMAGYFAQERRALDAEIAELNTMTPFRKHGDC